MNQVKLITEIVKILKTGIIENEKYFSKVESLSKEEWFAIIKTLLEKDRSEQILVHNFAL